MFKFMLQQWYYVSNLCRPEYQWKNLNTNIPITDAQKEGLGLKWNRECWRLAITQVEIHLRNIAYWTDEYNKAVTHYLKWRNRRWS